MFYVDINESACANPDKLRGWLPTRELADMHIASWPDDIKKEMSVIPGVYIAGVTVPRRGTPPQHLQMAVAEALNTHIINQSRVITSPRVQIEPKETVDLETKIMHFLVEKLGGHSLTIVRNIGTPETVRLLGFSVGKGSFAIRDLLDVVNGPDDGRPCAMDKFVADLFEACDDHYDREAAINHWLHGEWTEAMAYLKDEDADE